jgi:hypothetical protein
LPIVESQNYLGIYISKDTATVVCLDSRGKSGNVLDCFSVSVEEQEQANMLTLASLIADGCAERRLKFSEVAVALDCAMFMQHRVHSEFTDPKRIAATVKFDTEEVLATDIADVALAFEIASSDESGSELTVFTAERKVLSDVLVALQQYDLDPVTIEPDVNCLSRFICGRITSVEPRQAETLFGILSRRTGYLIVPPTPDAERPRTASTVRTFLVGPMQDRAKLLAREVLVTTALVEGAEPIHYLKLFDSAGAADYRQLGEKLSVETGTIDLCEAAGTELQTLADCANPVDFAIAYGVALSRSQKGRSVDFRDDFSPFQGKKLRLQKSLKFAAASVTVLFIAAGLYFHPELFRANRDISNIRSRFAEDYKDVALERLSDNLTIKDAVGKLRGIQRHIEGEKTGPIADEKSISSKLALVLMAFNKCAAQTNLNIKSASITTRNISITGDTSSRQNTLKFFNAVRNNGLEISQEDFDSKGGRDSFNISVALKK